MKQVIQLMSILFILMSVSCKKKNQTPTEYFSFDADGVHYDYPQDETEGSLFVGAANTLGAGRTSTTVGYQIYAFSLSDPLAPCQFQFLFNGNYLPTQDTVYIDGNTSILLINDFLTQGCNYQSKSTRIGRIILQKELLSD